jgi:hypothetical protein
MHVRKRNKSGCRKVPNDENAQLVLFAKTAADFVLKLCVI